MTEWPHRTAARLLSDWAATQNPRAKAVAQAAYDAHMRETAELVYGLLRAVKYTGGPDAVFLVVFGEVIEKAVQDRLAAWQKVVEALTDARVEDGHRLDRLERELKALRGVPRLRIAEGG